jgi:hypothetical protein
MRKTRPLRTRQMRYEGRRKRLLPCKQEEALLRRARKLVDLGDHLKSIREELEQVAFDIYDEVGESRHREGGVGESRDREADNGGGGVTEN